MYLKCVSEQHEKEGYFNVIMKFVVLREEIERKLPAHGYALLPYLRGLRIYSNLCVASRHPERLNHQELEIERKIKTSL